MERYSPAVSRIILRGGQLGDGSAGLRASFFCSGQPIPDSKLSFSSATAGGSPSLY